MRLTDKPEFAEVTRWLVPRLTQECRKELLDSSVRVANSAFERIRWAFDAEGKIQLSACAIYPVTGVFPLMANSGMDFDSIKEELGADGIRHIRAILANFAPLQQKKLARALYERLQQKILSAGTRCVHAWMWRSSPHVLQFGRLLHQQVLREVAAAPPQRLFGLVVQVSTRCLTPSELEDICLTNELDGSRIAVAIATMTPAERAEIKRRWVEHDQLYRHAELADWPLGSDYGVPAI